ncbi:ATP-binding protein [Ramlibacter sp. MMS24-I3-19]|uniref:ATP-binding protein n=1 Tax=Ramlibacter sp. MMS24-I3-19 TaxID=3416606 RepID=UPI003D007F41
MAPRATNTAEGTPMYLTVLAQPGGLAAALTDLGSMARMETIPTAETGLAGLQRECEGRIADAALGRSDDDTGRPIRELGSRLLGQLLPAGIAALLRTAAPAPLTLQLDASLAWAPWELLWDGEQFLGERFPLTRRILAADTGLRAARHAPGRGALKVLVIAGGKSAPPAVSRLNAGLRSMAGLAVSMVSAGDLPRSELLRLMAASDVAHYVGRVDGRPGPGASALWWWEGEPLDIGAIASLESPPRLLLSQDESLADGAQGAANRAVAISACRCGLNILACESSGHPQAHEFMLPLYAALVRGATLAGAVRSARVAFRREAGIAALAALRPELSGDGSIVISESRTPVDDSLRQLTILSIDLVGSTRLIAELGAEAYSEVLAQYHRQCAEIVRAHGGTPDDFQGDDGAMCYFGTPVAREDAAAQALQASLEVVDAVRGLGLHVRIGVCTGQVVVRDGQPVGAAIHLAARLQAMAEAGTVLVGDTTRRIVKDRFRFEPLPQALRLKGFDTEQVCHWLVGPALPASAAGQAASELPALTPFVNRNDELHKLQAHWDAARAGSLRIVRILGEAGIGKSRLVREFRRILVDAGHAVFECRCSPEHVNSAFHPLIRTLRSELRLRPDEPAEGVLARLRAMVSRAGPIDEGAMALLADLLSLPMPATHPILDQGPQRRRQLTVDLLVHLAQLRLRQRPGCLFIEDTHWLDPSTAEFLDRLATATRAEALLILATVRSDGENRWHPRFAVYETELQGLSPALARAMVTGTCGDRRLPPELVQLIAARTDGIPLFIEETARMAIDLGADQAMPSPAPMPVPATVLDLLAARLDRLGTAKQVAQVGGTIGREFPLALLRAVVQHARSPDIAEALDAQLAELVRAGMLVARDDGDGDGERYMFRHALMRDAAYGSLLDRDRLRLHQVIASVIAERFPDLAQRQPELLAFHYTEAGMDAEALRFWEAAARKAASRSANAEAIGHANHALAVLARNPAGIERDRAELRLQLLLAARLIATRGYGAERVERAYARAMELARVLGDQTAAMRVLLGLEGYHFMRADFDKARACALEAGARADSATAAIQRVQTLWALANIRMHQGDMAQAVKDMDACRAESTRLAHRPEAVQDPGVMCLCYSAWSLWQLGMPDEARDRVVAVVAHAERIRHQFSIGEAYGFHAAVLHFRGENREALASAERAVRVCEDHGFAVWLAHARVMRGRIAADLGDVAAGGEEMRQGFEAWADSGAVVTTPFYLTMRAEGHALGGRPEDGLALLEQALAIVDRTGERYYEAEIRRLTGVLTLQSARRAGLDRSAEAQGWMQQALDCARARSLGSLALRAAMDLAGLWQSQGRTQDAQAVLAPACDAIVGGAGTRDVVQARARLAALRGPVGVV